MKPYFFFQSCYAHVCYFVATHTCLFTECLTISAEQPHKPMSTLLQVFSQNCRDFLSLFFCFCCSDGIYAMPVSYGGGGRTGPRTAAETGSQKNHSCVELNWRKSWFACAVSRLFQVKTEHASCYALSTSAHGANGLQQNHVDDDWINLHV